MTRETQGDIRLYHVDHLGSTTLVTDIDGEITQHVAYIPYGEVFVEQRNGSWNTPYLFNAKELDEETGLYYYGARYLDPTHAAWLSVDPLFEKYVGMTPYNYCAGNPVKLVDVDGMRPVYDEDGNFMGTDDKGTQGDPIVMWNDKFRQGMSSDEAALEDLGLEFLNAQVGFKDENGKDPYDRFLESYINLTETGAGLSSPTYDQKFGFVVMGFGNAYPFSDSYNSSTAEHIFGCVDLSWFPTGYSSTSRIITPTSRFMNFLNCWELGSATVKRFVDIHEMLSGSGGTLNPGTTVNVPRPTLVGTEYLIPENDSFRIQSGGVIRHTAFDTMYIYLNRNNGQYDTIIHPAR